MTDATLDTTGTRPAAGPQEGPPADFKGDA
jgi:hypothetical protein